MTVGEAITAIQGRRVTGPVESEGVEATGGYVSDLLSDVMARASEGDVWVTLQRHVNIVAVAQLKGVAAIVLVNGREPEPETADRANREGVVIVTTPMSAFDAAGILYGMGLRSRTA